MEFVVKLNGRYRKTDGGELRLRRGFYLLSSAGGKFAIVRGPSRSTAALGISWSRRYLGLLSESTALVLLGWRKELRDGDQETG